MMQGADNPAFVPDSELSKRNKPWTKHRVAQLSVSSPPSVTTAANGGSNNNVNDDELVDFDDVLPSVGEFGTYQIILFFLTAPFCFFLAFSYFSQVFITLVPDHWCRVPQLDNSTLELSLHQRRELSIPQVEPAFLGGPAMFDTCSMYDVDYDDVIRNNLRPNASWKTKSCTDGWEYDYEQTRYSTIVSEFNWVCDDAGKPPLAQALFFGGSIVGGILLGYLADRFGRIPALILCNLIGAVAGIITTFSFNFPVFAFSRFLMGMAFDNCFTLMYILVLEYVGPTYRTIAANLSIALFYTAGTTLLPWIAWGISDWRMFSLATAVPMASALTAYWIVPESARWLLSQGQSDRAISILRTFARINKKQVDESVYKKLKASTEEARRLSAKEPAHTVLDLLKTPRLRRNTILLTLLWVLVAVVYDGHARNTANLGLSVFLTFSVASVTELPADLVLVFFLDRWGRRALAFGSLLGAAVFSLATLAIPIEQAALTAALAIVGRFCVNITFNIGLQYGAELIPTAVRAQGIAYVHIAGYVAAIISPYIVDLARFSRFLPLTILGLLALIGAVVGLMLPETLGAILPETIEDGENFGKDQSFWDFPCCPRRNRSTTTGGTASRTNSVVSSGGGATPGTTAIPMTATSVVELVESEPEGAEDRRPRRNSSIIRKASIRGEMYRSSLISRQSSSDSLRKDTLKRTVTNDY